MYLYGHGVKKNAQIKQAAILDVAPTVLSLLGLVPARDMPGRVLEEALEVSTASSSERISSYEDGSGSTASSDSGANVALDPTVTAAQLEHLRALGYLDQAPSDGVDEIRADSKAERNLAAIALQEGRYQEAEQIYRVLIGRDPEDSALRASLAGVLGAQSQLEGALAELDLAIELDELNIEAYHNRAVIEERRARRSGQSPITRQRCAIDLNMNLRRERFCASSARATLAPQSALPRKRPHRWSGKPVRPHEERTSKRRNACSTKPRRGLRTTSWFTNTARTWRI